MAVVSKTKIENDSYEFRSKVAEHVYKENHPITASNIKILRNVSSPWKLDVAERLEISIHCSLYCY